MYASRFIVKILILITLSNIVTIVSANTPPMPENMKQLQAAMQCMQGIDESALKALEQKSNKIKTEVDALCQAGKRDKAQSKVMTFAKDMMKSPAIKQMMVCRNMAAGMIPQLPFENFEKNAKNKHVCDDMN